MTVRIHGLPECTVMTYNEDNMQLVGLPHKNGQVRDRAWFVRLYGEIIPSFSEGIIDRTGTQTILYLTCTTITSVNLAHYGVPRAKDWVSVDCGTK